MNGRTSDALSIAFMFVNIMWVSLIAPPILGIRLADVSYQTIPALIAIYIAFTLIGLLWAKVALLLCRSIDTVYGTPNKWNNWLPESRQVFAMLWPIVGLPAVLVATTALIVGLYLRGKKINHNDTEFTEKRQ
jgi:hypothetical protein